MPSKIITCTLLLSYCLSSAWASKPNQNKQSPMRKTYSQEIIQDKDDYMSKKPAELISMIKGFQMVIQSETNLAKKINFIHMQSAAYLALVRSVRVKTPQTEQDKKNEKVGTERVIKNSNQILTFKESTDKDKAKAYYYAGLALSYQNNLVKSTKAFQESIRLYPDSSWAPGISIAIAEYFFDLEKYADAITQYKVYFKRYGFEQKSLATYKIAWAYINLSKYKDAEKFFLFLVDKPWAKGYALDSLRDLAYTMTFHRSESSMVEFANQNFANNVERRGDLLVYAFKYLIQQSGTKRRTVILDEILRTEKRNDKKLSVLISALRGQQREYASIEPYREFASIMDFIIKEKVNLQSKEMTENSAELEPEVLQLIKSYLETYLGKTKSPENLPKSVLMVNLNQLLEFHDKNFPNSPERIRVFSVWLDLCQAMKSPECSYKAAKNVINDPKLKELNVKAYSHYIFALGSLMKTQPQMREELINSLREYSQKKPDSPDWLIYVKKLTYLLNEDKKFEESYKLLVQIDKIEKSSESYFRLQWCRFQLLKYDEVISDRREFADKNGADSLALVRDSLLKLAEKSIQANSFDDYEKYVHSFLDTKPDPTKDKAARLDYIARLIQQNQLQKGFDELLKIPFKQRIGEDFRPLLLRINVLFMKQGMFFEVKKLLEEYALGTFPDFDALYLHSKMGLKEKIPFGELEKVKKNVKLYDGIHTFYSIYDPDYILELYSKRKDNSLFIKKLILFSLQVKQQKYDINLDEHYMKLLADVVPPEFKNRGETKAEKALKQIKAPSYSLPEEQLFAQTEKTVAKIRLTRPQVIKDIEGKTNDVKYRILDLASTVEDDLGKFIENSPAPKAYSEQEVAEYKKSVSELAQEFYNQAEEYRKLRLKIFEAHSADVKTVDANQLNSIQLPTDGIMDVVNKFLNVQSHISAALIIDYWFIDNDKRKEDYYKMKAYINLKYQLSDLMVNYVKSDLKANNLEKLIPFL